LSTARTIVRQGPQEAEQRLCASAGDAYAWPAAARGENIASRRSLHPYGKYFDTRASSGRVSRLTHTPKSNDTPNPHTSGSIPPT